RVQPQQVSKNSFFIFSEETRKNLITARAHSAVHPTICLPAAYKWRRGVHFLAHTKATPLLQSLPPCTLVIVGEKERHGLFRGQDPSVLRRVHGPSLPPPSLRVRRDPPQALRLVQRRRHLVRRPQRRRERRWCMRVPGRRRPGALLLHDRRRQPVHLPGRQGLRLLLPGEMHRPRLLLVQPGDRRAHRPVPSWRGVPGRARPLRPQRDGVRRHGEARPGRPAPRRRTSPNPVHTGPVQLAGDGHSLQGGRRLQLLLPRHAHRVRGRRRRPVVGGAHAERRQRRGLDQDGPVVGRGVEVQLRGHAAGALLGPPHLQLRQAPRGEQRHPRRLEARQHLPLRRQLLKS
uniref:Uncharacterized protein n=1 Tax=Aegilops tauschii subsp. strangulata TaxID=200361 RepID=A0A453P8K4_AEGTS